MGSTLPESVSLTEWEPLSTETTIQTDRATATPMATRLQTRLRMDRCYAWLPMPSTTVVYCLTRDHELAAALDDRLSGAIGFFYNDAARLHQAIVLRRPDLVVIDISAIRREYGDAGLGPVVGFVRERAPEARLAVRPSTGAHWLVGAEAGEGVEMLPAEVAECVEAVAFLCGCP